MSCDIPILPKKFLAIGCILIFTWLNMVSIKWSCKVNFYTGYFKVLTLVFIIILGIIMAVIGDRRNFQPDVFFA